MTEMGLPKMTEVGVRERAVLKL